MNLELYKATPIAWDEKRSYLILEKINGRTSYGKITERYEVVSRWSKIEGCEKGILSNSLKGVQYNTNELKDITKINQLN